MNQEQFRRKVVKWMPWVDAILFILTIALALAPMLLLAGCGHKSAPAATAPPISWVESCTPSTEQPCPTLWRLNPDGSVTKVPWHPNRPRG